MKTLTPYLAAAAFITIWLGVGAALDGPHELDVAQATADTVTALPAQQLAMRVTR